MNDIESSNDRWQTKTLWYPTAAVTVLILGFALFRAVSFSLSETIVLAIASFVSILISRYDFRIPKTNVIIAPKNIFAFWAIVWLGIGGGVIIGLLGAAAASWLRIKDDKKRFLFEIASDIVAIFTSAFVFYVSSGNLESFNGRVESPLVGNERTVLLAIVLLGITHYLVVSALSYIYYRIDGQRSIRQVLRDIFVFPAASYALTIGATIVLNFTFAQFGIELGVVLVPIAVIATVVHTIHLRRLAQQTRQISDASRIHLATVEALATAIDARDQVGIGHVRRTQIYAIGIGELMDLPEKEINALRTGALLHDIGKLAVPDHILNKPGRLTPAETEKTKIHSSVGASILEKVGFDYPVVPTVRYHHENWDGTGYPEGLRAEHIPLTARILAIADAFDTLRGARPYRPPVSKREACSHIRAEAGRKFDPALVNIFLSNLPIFEAEISRSGLSYRSEFGESRGSTTSVIAGNPSYVEQIKLANREVFTLYELARDFSSSLNLEETLSLFTRKIREFVPFDTCVVYLFDEKTESAKAAHVEGKHGAVFLRHEIRLGEGATGLVLKTREAMKDFDPAIDLDEFESVHDPSFRTMTALPLLAEEKLIGAVSLYSSELVAYGEEHLRLLETISRIASDAISKSRRHAEAENHALTDPMTGLPNARSLHHQFEKEVARAARTGSSFQLLMLDLDGFKAVNDTFGHKIGDVMLAEIGRIIGGQLRDYDFLARYAGDEFVAVIPETASYDVLDLCRRIEQAVGEFALSVGDEEARVGVSVGAASFPQAGETFDQLLIAADKGMYAVKSQRKRSVTKTNEKKAPKPDATEQPVSSAAPYEVVTVNSDSFTIELDETHIVSTSVN